MNEQDIIDHLNRYDYDIRKSHDARWIDQKCTMDVISLIADCIIEHTDSDLSKEFVISDIWHSKYAIDNILDIFQKPNPEDKAQNEYDKWFSQPIKLLGYSRVLNCDVRNGRNYFTIGNLELLEYLSIRERNAFRFLCLYIEKVLRDSGIYHLFENFFEKQDKNSFIEMKKGFSSFTMEYTPINGEVECNRIFIKVLNPLACKYKKLGTVRGSLSKDVITIDMIMYNQRNWRDLYSNKPKDVTRVEHEATIEPADKMTDYKVQKAKRVVRVYNDKFRGGRSEVYEERYMQDLASQIHHIFPASDFPDLADSLENLIALTPTQHLINAHPENVTKYINKEYQRICLLAKADTIRENLTDNRLKTIYNFDDFKNVLSTGFNTDKFQSIPYMDFEAIKNTINTFY